MDEIIRIKSHHFIDILTAYGAGRRTWQPMPEYGHAQHIVAARLMQDRNGTLEMCSGADDICAPCVHNIDGCCDDMIDTSFRPEAPSSKRLWNLLIDNRWYERLHLADGDRLTARQFAKRVEEGLHCGLDAIYREIPAARNTERLRKLEAGVARYLGKSS